VSSGRPSSQHRGEEVNSTGDGFFVAFEPVREALECAVDIQRSLARHRRDHGFAPKVRIGLHSAEATRDGRDYRGRGVHVAARIGAAAAGEEILVSSTALGDIPATRFGLSDARHLTLKGVVEPGEVRSVDWRWLPSIWSTAAAAAAPSFRSCGERRCHARVEAG
jgi:class 3 adenylate cyclase